MTGDSGASVGGASNSGGPDAALGELGRAITRAADALVALPSNDAATAYRCARALDAAFDDLTDLLQTVPSIVGLGDPGRKVSERLEQRRGELATRRGEITAYRAKLDDLAETERSLEEKTAEADRLRERISELERTQQLALEIPGLRTHVKALEEAVTAAGVADTPEIRVRISEAVGKLATLSEQQREAIGEGADKLVADAQKAARELGDQQVCRDATADLAKRESEAAQSAADQSEMISVLTAWSQADADLADGLQAAGFGTGGNTLETVQTELNGVRDRLIDLDNRLGPLLREHARAYEEARRVQPL